VGTVVAFRSGSPEDERLILPFFEPYIAKGEISNLPSYNFYARITAIDTQEPLSGVTKLIDVKSSQKLSNLSKEYSRNTYGIKATEEEPIKVSSKKVKTSPRSDTVSETI